MQGTGCVSRVGLEHRHLLENIYARLEEVGLRILVANAHHIKNVNRPGFRGGNLPGPQAAKACFGRFV